MKNIAVLISITALVGLAVIQDRELAELRSDNNASVRSWMDASTEALDCRNKLLIAELKLVGSDKTLTYNTKEENGVTVISTRDGRSCVLSIPSDDKLYDTIIEGPKLYPTN